MRMRGAGVALLCLLIGGAHGVRHRLAGGAAGRRLVAAGFADYFGADDFGKVDDVGEASPMPQLVQDDDAVPAASPAPTGAAAKPPCLFRCNGSIEGGLVALLVNLSVLALAVLLSLTLITIWVRCYYLDARDAEKGPGAACEEGLPRASDTAAAEEGASTCDAAVGPFELSWPPTPDPPVARVPPTGFSEKKGAAQGRSMIALQPPISRQPPPAERAEVTTGAEGAHDDACPRAVLVSVTTGAEDTKDHDACPPASSSPGSSSSSKADVLQWLMPAEGAEGAQSPSQAPPDGSGGGGGSAHGGAASPQHAYLRLDSPACTSTPLQASHAAPAPPLSTSHFNSLRRWLRSPDVLETLAQQWELPLDVLSQVAEATVSPAGARERPELLDAATQTPTQTPTPINASSAPLSAASSRPLHDRVAWLDTAKFLALLLVMQGHTAENISTGEGTMSEPLLVPLLTRLPRPVSLEKAHHLGSHTELHVFFFVSGCVTGPLLSATGVQRGFVALLVPTFLLGVWWRSLVQAPWTPDGLWNGREVVHVAGSPPAHPNGEPSAFFRAVETMPFDHFLFALFVLRYLLAPSFANLPTGGVVLVVAAMYIPCWLTLERYRHGGEADTLSASWLTNAPQIEILLAVDALRYAIAYAPAFFAGFLCRRHQLLSA